MQLQIIHILLFPISPSEEFGRRNVYIHKYVLCSQYVRITLAKQRAR